MQVLDNFILLGRRFKRPVVLAVTVVLTVIFAILNQPAAAALIPFISGLLAEIARRDARAHEIALRVRAAEPVEKIEVPNGEWGELCRAINQLLQERQLQQRLQQALPLAPPEDVLRALLSGSADEQGEARVVTVLLAGCGPLPAHSYDRRESLHAWRAVAETARGHAQRHRALLQPFGGAVMLVFGAFGEETSESSLRAALAVAEQIERTWIRHGGSAATQLTLSLAGGPALVTALPGVGYCAFGAPIDQAGQLQRLSASTPRFRLLCSESIYYRLKRSVDQCCEPTGLHTFALDGRPQAVYGMAGAALAIC
jgi:hypothetical protein